MKRKLVERLDKYSKPPLLKNWYVAKDEDVNYEEGPPYLTAYCRYRGDEWQAMYLLDEDFEIYSYWIDHRGRFEAEHPIYGSKPFESWIPKKWKEELKKEYQLYLEIQKNL